MALYIRVSIPQAVGTVATILILAGLESNQWTCFNTASGRHCCNDEYGNMVVPFVQVSIPQAVGTVATNIGEYKKKQFLYVSIPQAVGTVATAGS